MFGRRTSSPPADPATERLRCSFCNKDEGDVRKLIAGPAVFICNECVDVCNDIMADDASLESRKHPAQIDPSPDADPPGAQPCLICGTLLLPEDDGLVVEDRGYICLRCGRDLAAAMADRK
jgi:hypothetical protein